MAEAGCYDLAADCRVRLATDLIAHTWDPVILASLRRGASRRQTLIGSIGGISDKAFSESIRRLISSGLVLPTERSSPRHVEYELTRLGSSFVDGPISALGQWALEHGEDLMDAQLDNSS